MCGRGETYKVLVADFILGQQQKMIVGVLARAAVGFTIKSAAGCYVHFTADDRLEIPAFGFLIKIYHAVHHTVIGDGQRWKVHFHRTVY